MFTDRFIKLPIKVFDIKTKELTGEEGELIESYEMINPFEIQSYRPNVDNDNEIYLTVKGREAFSVFLSMATFELLLNKHFSNAD